MRVHATQAHDVWFEGEFRRPTDLNVLLDGEPIHHMAFEADSEEGWVRCYEKTPEGCLIPEQDHLKEITLYGKVLFFLPNRG